MLLLKELTAMVVPGAAITLRYVRSAVKGTREKTMGSYRY